MTKNKLFMVLGCVFAFGVVLSAALPVYANPQQPQIFYYTPTPDESGRIIYIVKENDTCISISLLTGVSLDQLRLLNDLTGDECLITPGQELLLGIAEEPVETPGPTPTPTSLLPTPTPYGGNAEVCVFLFEDINGNALAEDTELPLAGGAVSISSESGTFSETGDTVFSEDAPALCFADVPEGKYNISVAVPDGYNATTITNYQLELQAGDRVILDFGAQRRSENIATDETGNPKNNRSPMLGVFGGILLVGGAALGIYVWMLRRSNSLVP